MPNILLPYAINSAGNLTHIDNANKGELYTCPECNTELSLKISKIPKGEKFHRRNHFAHKCKNDNKCSESFLHKLFKQRMADYISKKITEKQEINFSWHCNECDEIHSGNLIKKIALVKVEHEMSSYKPDIALIDANDNTLFALEIVVTHKPEKETLDFYSNNKIICIEFIVTNFDDCEKIPEKIAKPDIIHFCPNPICELCGRKKSKANIAVYNHPCWNCGSSMPIAIIYSKSQKFIHTYNFSKEEIRKAINLGANIDFRYSKTTKQSDWVNVCKQCNRFIGITHTHELFEYIDTEAESESAPFYKCFNYDCIEKNRHIIHTEKHNEKDTCPYCGNQLILKKSKFGNSFYGCSRYPSCKFTKPTHN